MAYEYAQLSMGVNDKKGVSQLQALLNQKMDAGLEVDGIFGPKTSQAVKKYQQQNALEVDGIVGPKTWASLLSTNSDSAASSATQTSSAAQSSANRTEALKEAAAAAKEAYEKVESEKALSERKRQYEQAAKDYLERPGFSYDLQADPLYQQYVSQYTGLGRQAMEDTMGKAAALTGGYGNSYAQTAGQQAYGSYLQQISDRIPELYELALNVYEKEGDRLRSRYELLGEMEEQTYDRKQDDLDREDALRKENYEKEQDTKEEQQTNREYLNELILAGYIPTDQELAAANMTREQANALWLSSYR